MLQIRSCKSAQDLMDKLFDDGFVRQSADFAFDPDRELTVEFLAEKGGGAVYYYSYYEGVGSTLLRAIRNAIAAGEVE